MYRFLALAAIALMLLPAGKAHAQADQQKLAQTGLKFLAVSNDPRAAAMSNAVMAIEGMASSLFYNPAGMARQGNLVNVYAGQTQWIAGINHTHTSATFSPLGGRLGVIGVSVQAVSYGDFQETVRWDNEAGFRDLGTFSPTALAVGVGYARALTDRFSVGGHVKLASQDLGSSVMRRVTEGEQEFERQDNRVNVAAFDFGVLYRTGFNSLNLAMAIRNFSQEVSYERENFQLPLNFFIGLSMDMVDLTQMDPSVHSLIAAVTAERPRDYSEMVNFGLEYTFMNTVSLRSGYALLVEGSIRENHQEGLSLGAGIRQNIGGIGFGADYAFTQFGVFDNVHRVALQLSF